MHRFVPALEQATDRREETAVRASIRTYLSRRLPRHRLTNPIEACAALLTGARDRFWTLLMVLTRRGVGSYALAYVRTRHFAVRDLLLVGHSFRMFGYLTLPSVHYWSALAGAWRPLGLFTCAVCSCEFRNPKLCVDHLETHRCWQVTSESMATPRGTTTTAPTTRRVRRCAYCGKEGPPSWVLQHTCPRPRKRLRLTCGLCSDARCAGRCQSPRFFARDGREVLYRGWTTDAHWLGSGPWDWQWRNGDAVLPFRTHFR